MVPFPHPQSFSTGLGIPQNRMSQPRAMGPLAAAGKISVLPEVDLWAAGFSEGTFVRSSDGPRGSAGATQHVLYEKGKASFSNPV